MSEHTTMMQDTAIIAGMVEIERLRRENTRLREVLEDLTSLCEQHRRIVYMGWAWDKYEFAFDPKHDNPVKKARATLQEDNDE